MGALKSERDTVVAKNLGGRTLRARFKAMSGYLFIAPAILYLTFVVGYSIIYTIRLSFFEFSYGTRIPSFVGFKHYVKLLSDQDIWSSARVTLVFTVAAVVLHLLVGGLFALLLNERWFSVQLRNGIRGLLILPWLFSFAAAALVWGLLFHPFGVLNYFARVLGITDGAVEFLGRAQLALPSLIVVNIWKTFPFYMVMILGGLQSIPTELYEAAKVDGASPLQRFWRITLPLVRPVLVAITSLDIITTFGHYDLVKTLTEGGPFGTTRTLAYYIWLTGFQDGNFGYGAAASVVLLACLSGATLLYLRLFAQKEELYGETTTGI